MAKVVIANRWVSPEGRTYKGGDVAEVSPAVARDLVSRGKARHPEPVKPAEAEKEARKNG